MQSAGFSRTVRDAYAWVVTGTVIRHGISFGLSMLLARLLTPQDYGVVGLTTVFISVLVTLQSLGIGAAVAYFHDDESKLPTYYTIAAVMGVLGTILTCAVAPLMASFYDTPQLVPMLRALSLLMLLAGFRIVSETRLGRMFQFKRLVLMESIANLFCGCVAVVLAANGFGAWSLIANWVLVGVLQTAGVIYMMPPRFTLDIDMAVFRKGLAYGLPQMGSNLLWKMYDNVDYLVIGKLLGNGPLGTYTVAFRIATLVNEKVSAIVSRISFNAFAALKNQPDRGASHWLSLTNKIATLNFLLLALLAVLSEDLVIVVLGQKWAAAILPMRILCVVGALRTLGSITTNVLTANGYTKFVFKTTLANTIVMPVAMIIACTYGGIVGAAIAWCIVLPISVGVLLRKATQVVGITMNQYLSNLRFPVSVAGLCILGSLPLVVTLDPGLRRLLLAGAAGALTGGALLLRHPLVVSIYAKMMARRDTKLAQAGVAQG